MFRETHPRIATALLTCALLGPVAHSADTPEGAKGGLDEIVVTAQRREQSLKDVPISVSVASAEQLSDAGIIQSTQLPQLTPGLVMDSAATYQQTYLRGVGSEFVQPGTNQSVATYIDGVVIVSPTALDQSLMDVERIEVLKGPQGTLFGRNAAGGAINIVTKRPSETPQAQVQVGVGNLDAKNVGLYLSGPVAGGLKASLAGFYNYRDAWYDNLAAPFAEKGAKQYGGRVKFLYEADNGVEAELSGTFAQQFNGDNFAYQQLQPNSVGAAFGGIGSSRPGKVYNDSHGKHYPAWVGRYRTASGTLRVKAPLGFADFVSISGFREGVN
ncbi:MAG: TonB-dependent receptor plug domain-containing protein, partial [Steroidobacteraceae bacterium]